MITTDELVSSTRRRQAPPPQTGGALWRMGFRPFFLLSALAAVFLVPWWVLGLMGVVPVGGQLGGVLWHAHEMLLGFAMGVVAGFLLTAVPKWTGTPALSGAPLKILAALWIAGRVGMGASGWLPPALVALLDLAFVPALAVALGRPLIATGNKRNWIFIALLGAMLLLNGAYHAQAVGLTQGGAAQATRGVMDLIVVMMVVIGGRIIPMFTRNGLAREGVEITPRPAGWVDKAAMAATVALIPLELLPTPTPLGVGSVVAALLVGARLWGWGGLKTARVPLLWILHVGYLWIAVGLVLRGVAILAPGSIPPTAALHALTAGAMGSLILGMIARVSLGHTGRLLQAKPAMTVGFGLIVLCGIVRVGLPIVAPSQWMLTHHVSALLWTAPFAIFLWIYTPWLLAPRPDGAPG